MADPSPPNHSTGDVKDATHAAQAASRRDSIKKLLSFAHEDMQDVKDDAVPSALPGAVPSTAEGYSIYSDIKDGKVSAAPLPSPAP